MQLTEHDGKRVLARHGVPVPRGSLYDPASTAADAPFPVMAKTQLLSGARGKRGGIKVARSAAELNALAAEFRTGTEELPPAQDVLVEELLDIDAELYLAVLVDREARAAVLLAHQSGGIEIEDQDRSGFLRLNVPTSNPLSVDVQASVLRHWNQPGHLAAQLLNSLNSLWDAFRAEDCLLAEINPLAVTADGGVVAADARVVLDDSAAARHPEWPKSQLADPFESAVAAAGAVGARLDGNVAIVTSGAGLGMATVDLVAAAGAKPAALIDLGGTVFGGPEGLTNVLRCVLLLRPDVLLVNVFLQAGPCDDLAYAFLNIQEQLGATRCVLRMRGHRADEAYHLLNGSSAYVTHDLREAVAEAVGAGHDTRQQKETIR
jgi:succinyl-CoA synthetase beta subunit